MLRGRTVAVNRHGSLLSRCRLDQETGRPYSPLSHSGGDVQSSRRRHSRRSPGQPARRPRMNSYHALYYPTWTIDDPVFLFEALLYWDRLACIVPHERFPFHPSGSTPDLRKAMAEAHEQFVSRIVPTDEQKRAAHTRIEVFADREAPEWC